MNCLDCPYYNEEGKGLCTLEECPFEEEGEAE